MQHQSRKKTRKTSFKVSLTITQMRMRTVTQMIIILTNNNNKNHQHSIHLPSHPTTATTHKLLISNHSKRAHSIILNRMRKMTIVTTSLNQAIIIRTTNKRRDWRSLKTMMRRKKTKALGLWLRHRVHKIIINLKAMLLQHRINLISCLAMMMKMMSID